MALLAQSTPASGQLQAGPTLLEITPSASSTRLFFHNRRSRPVAAQVRVFTWDQRAGEDHLEPSQDLAVSPPIIELPPDGEQVVRLVRLSPPAEGHDRTYRVIVDELPDEPDRSASVVALRVRYVIPLFVRAPRAEAPTLSCAVEAGGARLACENRGGRAAKLGASSLRDDSGAIVVLNTGLFGYVLPRARKVWPLPPAASQFDGLNGSTLELDTRLNGQPTKIPVGRVP